MEEKEIFDLCIFEVNRLNGKLKSPINKEDLKDIIHISYMECVKYKLDDEKKIKYMVKRCMFYTDPIPEHYKKVQMIKLGDGETYNI